MYRHIYIILFLGGSVFCDDCLTYNFEEGFENYFTNSYGICQGMATWEIGNYSALNIDSPHLISTSFISPRSTLSCISSFKFLITAWGKIEVNLFMVPVSSADQISVIVFQSNTEGQHLTVGNALLSPMSPNFVPGWQTITTNLVGFGAYEGYITIMGIASPGSYILVDSLRYISATFHEDSCVIYPDDEKTTLSPSDTSTEKPTITTDSFSTTTLTAELPTVTTVEDSPTLITTPGTVHPDIINENESLTTYSTIEMSSTKSTAAISTTTMETKTSAIIITTEMLMTTPITDVPDTVTDTEWSTRTTATQMLPTTSTTEVSNTVMNTESSTITATSQRSTTISATDIPITTVNAESPTTIITSDVTPTTNEIYTTAPNIPSSTPVTETTTSLPNIPSDFCKCVSRCFYQQTSLFKSTDTPTLKHTYVTEKI